MCVRDCTFHKDTQLPARRPWVLPQSSFFFGKMLANRLNEPQSQPASTKHSRSKCLGGAAVPCKGVGACVVQVHQRSPSFILDATAFIETLGIKKKSVHGVNTKHQVHLFF